MNPLVSICIPTYNNEATIERTVRSVLAQDYAPLEVVVSDDASTDRTRDVVAAIGDDRIRLIPHDVNAGMGGNWNQAIRAARGEYVKLLCADDLLYPGSVRKEAACLSQFPDVTLVMSDTALINGDDVRIGAFRRYPVRGRMSGRRLAKISAMVNNFFGAPCDTMFRRTDAERLGGFDESFTYILDFEFWMRLAEEGDVYILHELLNGFRVRADSNTDQVMGSGTRGQVYVAEHRRLVEKHAPVLGYGRLFTEVSVLWRRVRSRIIHYYMKIKQALHPSGKNA